MTKSIKKIIISVLNCQETDAIYIFGSYGTKYFTEESDIDIAWFTNSHIDLVTRGKFERFLEDVLKIPVDLVVVNKDSSPYLLCNIFEFGDKEAGDIMTHRKSCIFFIWRKK